MSSQYKLKQEKGVLHIGGGRFFYPNEIYDLTDDEAVRYGHYFSEEQAAALEGDEELDDKDPDNDRSENIVTNEIKADNIDDAVDAVEVEVKTESEPEAASARRKTNKAEK